MKSATLQKQNNVTEHASKSRRSLPQPLRSKVAETIHPTSRTTDINMNHNPCVCSKLRCILHLLLAMANQFSSNCNATRTSQCSTTTIHAPSETMHRVNCNATRTSQCSTTTIHPPSETMHRVKDDSTIHAQDTCSRYMLNLTAAAESQDTCSRTSVSWPFSPPPPSQRGVLLLD